MYDVYNHNVKQPRNKEPYRDPIDFTPYQTQIDAFKSEWIYSKQVQEELDTFA